MDSKALFEILIRENARSLTMFLRASGCDSAMADDISQEAMLIAWRKLDQFDQSRPFGPWLRGIAAKQLLAARRKNSRLKLIADENALEYLSEKVGALQNLAGDTLDEKLEALRDCIGRLPEHDRECVEMRFKTNQMPTAMAEKLGVALETVKKRLLRAKQRLSTCLEAKLAAANNLSLS